MSQGVISTKVKLDGEKEYKDAIAALNRSYKTLTDKLAYFYGSGGGGGGSGYNADGKRRVGSGGSGYQGIIYIRIPLDQSIYN